MGRETRAMQDDEATGPAALWLLDGEALWNQSCRSCHGDVSSMKGVATRYPAVIKGKLSNLEQRINDHQTKPLAYESPQLLALTAYVARQSRGMPIAVEINEETRPFFEAGRGLFNRRQGQLNLACSQCHDDNWGKKLSGSTIPQAHPTGYPLYRLEWQGMGSLQRRLRNCLIGMRAEHFDYGAPEYVALELYLMWRARGMLIESPAVRP